MGALEDYIRSQRKVKDRNDPMRDSVMVSQSIDPLAWSPEKDALEAPMVSPDDLIGTGIPTKIAMLASKVGLPKGMGALGMLIGARGAERLGKNHIIDALAREAELAARAKREGREFRLQAHSNNPRVHTGFDGKVWYETGDEDLLPYKNNLVYDKPTPILDQWRIPEMFRKAYEPELSATKLENSLTEPVGTGVYIGATNDLGLGYGKTSSKTANDAYDSHPMLRDKHVREALGHELTHLAQRAERAGGGTMPEYMGDALRPKNLEKQIEKHLLQADLYKTIASNRYSPLELLRQYSDIGASPELDRRLNQIIRNVHEGNLSPEDAMKTYVIHNDILQGLIKNQDDQATLQGLLNKGIQYVAPEEIKRSAAQYGATNKMRGFTPEEVANNYILYRANAAEAQAERVGNRIGMPLEDKIKNPFLEGYDFLPEYMHSVR